MTPLNAAAQCLGVNERTLRRWVLEGCPVTRRGTGPKAPMLFDLVVVRGWLRGDGRTGAVGRPEGRIGVPRGPDGRDARRVYFIQNITTGNIKAGMSLAPHLRLQQLQCTTDCDLELLGTIAGGVEIERAVHEGLAPHHIRGEWFHGRCRPVVDEILARWGRP